MTSESCTHQQTVNRFSFPTPCNTSVLPPAGLKHPDRVISAFPGRPTEKSTKGQSVKVQNSPGGSLTGRFPRTTRGYQQAPLSLSNSWGCMPQDPRSLGPSKREWIEAGSPPMDSVLNNSPQPSHFTPPTPRNPSHHLQPLPFLLSSHPPAPTHGLCSQSPWLLLVTSLLSWEVGGHRKLIPPRYLVLSEHGSPLLGHYWLLLKGSLPGHSSQIPQLTFCPALPLDSIPTAQGASLAAQW